MSDLQASLDRIIELLEGLQPRPRKKKVLAPSPGANDVIGLLNALTESNFRCIYRADLEARLAEHGKTAVEAVVAGQAKEWGLDSKMRKYLRPETLFNRTKFEGYLAAVEDRPQQPDLPPEPDRDGTYEKEEAWRVWNAQYGARQRG